MNGITKNFVSTVGALAALGLVGCGANGDLAGGGNTDLNPNLNLGDDTTDDLGNPDGPLDGNVATVRGFVKDPQSMGISGVKVSDWDGWETLTDSSGRYEMPDVDDGTVVNLIFEKKGYAGSYASFRVMAAGENFFPHTLAPVDLATEFDSEEGIAFTLDETHSFSIPAGTMRTQLGDAFEGNVFMNATVWDRSKPLDQGGEFLASPGNGRGITLDGEDQMLLTFGMFQMEFRADDGTALEPGPGFEMAVEVPPSAGVQDGEGVPFWNFDPIQNTWVEEDMGEITQLTTGEQVWEFTPTTGLNSRKKTGWIIGNPDKPVLIWVSAQADGTVTDPQGNPKPNVPVRVIAADQTFMQSTQTNADGYWSVNVPPVVSNPAGPNGRPMFIEVDYEVAAKPSLWRQNPAGPPGPGGTQDWGNTVVGSMTCIAGSVLDASGAAVAGVTVLDPHGGNATSNDDGQFCMNVPKWQPATVYAAPRLNSEVGFEPRKVRPVAAADGSCDMSCPNQVTLRAYPAIQCTRGEVYVNDFAADAVSVDSFDARFPNAPIFSTLSDAGEYCATVPADLEAVVRLGAGDLSASNTCGSYSVLAARDDFAQCDGGWCQDGPTIDCGE
jgi:hypothetical protein